MSMHYAQCMRASSAHGVNFVELADRLRNAATQTIVLEGPGMQSCEQQARRRPMQLAAGNLQLFQQRCSIEVGRNGAAEAVAT
eukprot:1691094-Pleurochrysis_carterae.AAC.1